MNVCERKTRWKKIERLLGKLTGSFPSMCFSPLHYKSLERDITLALKFAKENLDEKMEVSQEGRMDIWWWINNLENLYGPMQIPSCSILLKTDAPKSGWGAIFDKETTGRHFALDKYFLRINVLELKEVLLGLKVLCSHLRQPI